MEGAGEFVKGGRQRLFVVEHVHVHLMRHGLRSAVLGEDSAWYFAAALYPVSVFSAVLSAAYIARYDRYITIACADNCTVCRTTAVHTAR